MTAVKKGGFTVRQNYSDIGVDLTKYSALLAGKYGSKAPPDNVTKMGQEHLVHDLTEVETFDALRDFLHNGYGCSTCGGEGYSDARDENGVSKQKGSWAHAMACIGVDDRDEVKAKYNEPLVLILNSWANWNNGPRKIVGTEMEIPEGAFWTPWSHAKNREYIVHSGGAGFPRKLLPDYVSLVG